MHFIALLTYFPCTGTVAVTGTFISDMLTLRSGFALKQFMEKYILSVQQKHQTMRHTWGGGLQTFLTTALGGGAWLASRPGLFIPRNTTAVLDKWLEGPRAYPNFVAIKCLIIKENSCLQITTSNLNHFKRLKMWDYKLLHRGPNEGH
jgi:hypothetical protein